MPTPVEAMANVFALKMGKILTRTLLRQNYAQKTLWLRIRLRRMRQKSGLQADHCGN
ncbi:hypothetical protein [Coleofasciculus sp. FACHB-129]|uniref:hypothetical protein n=1 Tax=Coleofasciculus sp. FACHB-129 TaxID=2692785 RepID=UPI001A7E755B|nr:hypothetical protein [Coleofasciculus sp. FACHB-129]